MKAFDPMVALALPDSVLVNRRVPKTMLIENGAPTAADKRRIREGYRRTSVARCTQTHDNRGS